MLDYVLLFLAMLGGMGLPLGMPPGDEDPRMFQLAPDEALVYSTWVGIRKPDAQANPTEKWLAIKEIADSRKKVRSALYSFASSTWFSYNAELPDENIDRCMHLAFDAALSNPVAIYVRDSKIPKEDEDDKTKFAAVICLGDKLEEFKTSFAAWQRALANSKEEKFNNRLVSVPGADLKGICITCDEDYAQQFANGSCVVQVEDLVIFASDPAEVARVLKNLKTPPPRWLTQVRGELKIEQFGSMFFLDVEKAGWMLENFDLPWQTNKAQLAEIASGISTLTSVAGINKMGFVSQTKLTQKTGEARLLSSLGDKPLTPKEIGSLRRNTLVGLAIRIDGPRVVEMLNWAIKSYDVRQLLSKSMKEIEEFTGKSLKEEFSKGVGDFAAIEIEHSHPFADPFRWRMDIGIQEVMTFPSVMEQISQAITESVKQKPVGAVRPVIVDNAKLYEYTEDKLNPKYSWGVIDDRLVFGQTKSAAEIASPMAPAKDDQLAELPVVKQMLVWGKLRGFGEPIGILHFDIPFYFREFGPAIDSFVRRGQSKVFDDIDLRFGDLPRSEFWHQGAQTHVSLVYRVDGGLVFLQTQTYPGSNSLTTMFAIGLSRWLVDIRSSESDE